MFGCKNVQVCERGENEKSALCRSEKEREVSQHECMIVVIRLERMLTHIRNCREPHTQGTRVDAASACLLACSCNDHPPPPSTLHHPRPSTTPSTLLVPSPPSITSPFLYSRPPPTLHLRPCWCRVSVVVELVCGRRRLADASEIRPTCVGCDL